MARTILEGSRVLITGASSGIGRATALACARRGASTLLLARREEGLLATARAMAGQNGRTADLLACDVRETDTLRRLVAEADDKHPIDVLVANAGVGMYGPFATARWEDVVDVFRTNIDGVAALVHLLLPRMIARGRGSIVLVSSVLGKRALAWNAAYSASKYALQGLADALRLEAAPHGVHVGVVCPGRTQTEFFDRMHMTARQEQRRRVPEATPGRVAGAIIDCITRQRREMVVPASSLAFTTVGVHFPRLADFILSRAVPRPHGH